MHPDSPSLRRIDHELTKPLQADFFMANGWAAQQSSHQSKLNPLYKLGLQVNAALIASLYV